MGEPFVHTSITGASYTGRPVVTASVEGYVACRVAITGGAYMTAESTIYLDRSDVLADGFQLG